MAQHVGVVATMQDYSSVNRILGGGIGTALDYRTSFIESLILPICLSTASVLTGIHYRLIGVAAYGHLTVLRDVILVFHL